MTLLTHNGQCLKRTHVDRREPHIYASNSSFSMDHKRRRAVRYGLSCAIPSSSSNMMCQSQHEARRDPTSHSSLWSHVQMVDTNSHISSGHIVSEVMHDHCFWKDYSHFQISMARKQTAAISRSCLDQSFFIHFISLTAHSNVLIYSEPGHTLRVSNVN